MNSEIMPYEGGGNAGMAVRTVGAELVSSRQAQEVQVAMLAAKHFPRNMIEAQNRIIENCRRLSLAKKSTYEYVRGGNSVTGPSIRLAEVMAQSWGNLDFGFTVLQSDAKESTVMSYCWDLETNTRQTKTFTVPHIRHTKTGDTSLTDPRDVYEMIANQAARRVRACILGIIPGDIVDSAVAECQKTLAGQSKQPLIDRVRKMAQVFKDEFGVPLAAIEAFIGCKAEAFTEQSLVRLTGVYNSLKDGMAKREQYFDLSAAGSVSGSTEEAPAAPVTAQKGRKKKEEAPAAQTPPPPPPAAVEPVKQEKKDEVPPTADEWGEVDAGADKYGDLPFTMDDDEGAMPLDDVL